MTINDLLNKLTTNNYLTDQSLVLPSINVLGSKPLSDLIANTAFYTNSVLKLTRSDHGNPIVDDTIVLEGTFDQTFLGQANPSSTVVFFIDGNDKPQLYHIVNLPTAWKFSNTFSGLAGTRIDNFKFNQPAFALASVDTDLFVAAPLVAGLNFAGGLLISSAPLSNVAWLWGSTTQLELSGGVTLPTGTAKVPTMSLGTPCVPTDIKVGTVTFAAGIDAASKPGDQEDGAAEVDLSLTAQLSIGSKSIPITATLPDGDDIISLAMGSTQQPLATLNDLAAIANTTSLTNLIPSQFPLGNNLALVSLSLSIDPVSKTVFNLGFGVGLVNLTWTIVPPNIVVFNSIVFNFSVPFLTQSVIVLTINAAFTILDDGQRALLPASVEAGDDSGAVIALSAQIDLSSKSPSVIFSGFLASGSIDVIRAISQFFGATPSFDTTLSITSLNFQINPSDKTYRLNATVDTSDILTIPLGPDLPGASNKISITSITLNLQRQQTSTAIEVSGNVLFLTKQWTLSAERPGSGQGWTFTGMLAPNQTLTIGDVINGLLPPTWGVKPPDPDNLPAITAFQASFNTATKTFAVQGGLKWTITIIENKLVFNLNASVALQSTRTNPTDKPQYSGLIAGDVALNDIKLTAQYAFKPGGSQLTFVFAGITAVYKSDPANPSLTISFGNKSLGDILSFLIGLAEPGGNAKLPAPWSALNSVSLNGLQIQIFFKTGGISVTYPIKLDLGFIKINIIGFEYKRLYGKGDVQILLDADFLGQNYGGQNALKWNPATQSPPALPGAGAAAFDLQYLGLGQHVSLRANDNSLNTVDGVINALKSAVKPISDPSSNPVSQLPGIQFNSSSNWLIGAQFSVAGVFSMSLVFNDPNVYGLLIGLQGEKAGPLSGLRFEILYRKITDKIGLYHIDLKLPDAFRRLQLGQVTITLPIITVDIYTNGDFKVDFGFPTSLTNTSRCFAIEVFPFVGVGGFYFAKLSGDTSTSVPKIDNGRFNPVIEAGIALFIGVGKSLSLGVLSGGISITVNGIIQGVYAYFEPTDHNQPSATFFRLTGTIAIVGQVYATLDFGIIQASVSLTVYASVSLMFQVYEPIYIQISAGVDVSVSIKIIFIRIKFSFRATITTSFVIGSKTTPPWHVVSDGQSGRQRLVQSGASQIHPMLALANASPSLRMSREARPLAMSPLSLDDSAVTIELMFTPLITKALNTDFPPANVPPADVQAQVVISSMLFIGTSIAPDARTPLQASVVTDGGSAAGFNVLLTRLFKWAVNTIAQETDTVTASELEQIYKDLTKDTAFDQYFGYTNLSAFFTNSNITFQIDARPTSGDPVSAAFFPMIPSLALSTPNYSFDFGQEIEVSPEYENVVKQYFQDLAVDYANSVERNPDGEPDNSSVPAVGEPIGPKETMATFVFRRYFLMLTQSVVQSAIDFLKDYTYEVQSPATESLASIASRFPTVIVIYVTRLGDTLNSIAAQFQASAQAILIENPGVDFDHLAPGTEIKIPVGVTVEEIVTANRSTEGLLRQWPASGVAGNAPQRPVLTGIKYQVVDGDMLGGADPQHGISTRFGLTPSDVAESNLDNEGLFRPGASVVIGDLTYTSRNGDTLQSIAKYFGVSLGDMMSWNQPIPLLADGKQSLIIQIEPGTTYIVLSGDTVQSVALKFQISVDDILRVNLSIRVAAGVAIALKGISHTADSTFVADYMTTDGDSLDGIILRYFGFVDDQLRDLLKKWNPTVDFMQSLAPATLIEFPLSASLFHLQTYYAVPLATLLQTANITNNKLLAPLAILDIPDIAPAITATDSFESLATRYALPLDDLASELAQVGGLFRDATDNQNPSLTIPFVPAMNIEQLVTELGGSEKMNQSAMMTSRFMLQGLRVPPPVGTSDYTYPVFALIGQEFPAPVPNNAAGYTFTVKQGAAVGEEVPWVTLPSESGYSPTGTLTFELSPEEQTQIDDFQDTVLKPGVELCRRLPLSAYSADQHALEVQYVWQAGELPAVSCFTANGQLTGQPTLWPLPGDLKTAVADISTNGAPYKLVVGQPKPTGGTDFADASCYCWATMVDLTVSRVAVQSGDSPYLADTFLMLGSNQTGKELLYNILNYLSGVTGEEVSLFLLLPPSQSQSGSGGYVSVALDRAQSVLLKTNLSTLSHSGQLLAADVERKSADPGQEIYSATLEASDSQDFMTLLWQCSVVQSGGFYLTYRDTSGKSLPDWLFAGNNQGSISLLILLKSQLQSPQSLIRTFNNAAILGDNIDVSKSHLFARAVAPIVGKSTVQGNIAQTLQEIASQYLQVSATPASLASANKSIQNLLRTGASVAILNQPDFTVEQNDTFATIATARNINDVSLLGTWNAQRDILQPGAIMQLLEGQLKISAKLPPGNTGFLLTRDNPDATNPGADRAAGAPDPQQEINNLFNLLGFWISDNDFFKGSGEGLPAGPTESQQEGTDGLSPRAPSEEVSETWRYTQSLKAFASAKTNTAPNCASLPPIDTNPYAGIVADSTLKLSLVFQDLNGNRLTTDPPLQALDLDVGYTDELLTFARWPSVSAGYVFKRLEDNVTLYPQATNLAQLVTEWTFSCAKYMPGPGNDYPPSHNSARADREKMKAAYYQIRMPYVGFALSTTMGTVLDDETETVATKLLLALQDFVSSACVFLATAAALPPVTYKTGEPIQLDTETLNSIAILYSTAPGLVAEANADLTASNLFGASTALTIPEYYRFKTGDTSDKIVKELLPNGTPEQREQLLELMATSNENTPMRVGTAILAKLRQVTVDNSDSKLSTVNAISANFFVAIVDTTTESGDEQQTLVPGLATANKDKVLNKGTLLTLGDVSLTVGDLETLTQITNRFITEGVQDATVEAVAVQNQFALPFFAGNVVLDLPDYVIQPGDTLLSVANAIGPVEAGDDQAVIQLLKDNVLVPDLYPAGTMLYYGTTSYNILATDTLKSIADQFAITMQDLGTRNATVPLEADQVLRIPYLVDASAVQYSTYRATENQTFADIANVFRPSWNGVVDLAGFNRYVPSLFNPNQSIEIGGKQKKPALGDTFDSLATFFGMQNDFNAFAELLGPMPGVVRPQATIYAVTMKVADRETLSDAAARYHTTPAELADANASVYQLLQSDQTVTVAGYTASVLPADTFAILAAQINAMREANNESPGVSAADVGAANPSVKLKASNLVPPIRAASVAAAVETSFSAAIRPVQVTLAMTREYDLVDPEFKASKPVYSATTSVGAKPLENAEGDSQSGGSDGLLLSLRAFAKDFEEAFFGFKLATGADQNYLGDPQRAACGQSDSLLAQAELDDSSPDPTTYRQLWAVNFGTDGDASKRFNYQVLRDQALYYSLPPLSTELWDSPELTLKTYVSGQGLTGDVKRLIKAADVDQWAMSFLAAVDKFLSPEYASRVYEMDQTNGTSYFSDVVTYKGNLANYIKEEIETILEPAGAGALDASSGLEEAKTAFYQQLLVELSAAYATDVLVQYPFDVTAGCPNTGNANVAARLSGKPMARVYRTPEQGIINLPEIAVTLTATENVEYVAVVLQNIKYIITPGIEVKYTDPLTSAVQTMTTDNNTTIATIAKCFKVDVASLADGLEVVTAGKGLFRLNTSINVTAVKQEMSAGDLFSTLATKLSTTVESIMFANQDLPNVFKPGSTIKLKGVSKTVPPDGKPLSVALEFYPPQKPSDKLESLNKFALDLWSGELNVTAKYQLGTDPAPVLTLLVLPPVYTFTTGKVPMAQGTRFATFLFDVKDASHSRSVFLDLDYPITEMEYDIVSLASEFGQYQESSWLTFIIPITDVPNVGITAQGEISKSQSAAGGGNGSPNDGNLGLAQIPVPLRAYPEPFVVSEQSATTEPNTAMKLLEAETPDDVSLLFEWIYQFDMARRMAAQDSADLSIYLNVTDGGGLTARALAKNRDALFSKLAQFVFVYSDVAKDLDLLLRSNLTPDEQKTAKYAAQTFWTLVGWVKDAWPPPPMAQGVTTGPEPYKFHVETIVSESEPNKFGFLLVSFVSGPEDYLFSLPGSDAQFLEAGQIDKLQPAFESEGYALSAGATIKPVTPMQEWLIIDDDNQLTFDLVVNANLIDVKRKYLWPVISDVSGSEPVDLSAQQIGSTMLYNYDHLIDDPAKLLMQFKRLNVITKQNGWGGVSVTRNALLIPGRETQLDFIYQTPMTYFANKVTPNIKIDKEVSLRLFATSGAMLVDALSGYFETLFATQAAADPTSIRQVRVSARYGFQVASIGSAAEGQSSQRWLEDQRQIVAGFPLILIPQYGFKVATDWEKDPATSFVVQLASQTETARQSAGAPGDRGRYYYDVVVYSTLGGNTGQSPLIEFDALYYDLPESSGHSG